MLTTKRLRHFYQQSLSLEQHRLLIQRFFSNCHSYRCLLIVQRSSSADPFFFFESNSADLTTIFNSFQATRLIVQVKVL
jgi:hypothetical protein